MTEITAERTMIQTRLANIEKKLDELQDVMVALARVEERLSNHLNGVERLGHKVDDHEDRIVALEKEVAGNSRISRAVERIGWMVVSLVFSVLGYLAKVVWD